MEPSDAAGTVLRNLPRELQAVLAMRPGTAGIPIPAPSNQRLALRLSRR